MACSPLGCVTACVVYGQIDSKIRFENESDGRFDSRFDSNEKKRFAGPYHAACLIPPTPNDALIFIYFGFRKVKAIIALT